jgi:hypothetical protein
MSEQQTFKNFIEMAGARLKPFEEQTRRFFENTAERVRTTSTDGYNWVEENLKAQIEKANLTQRIEEVLQTREFKERLQRTMTTTLDRFQFAPKAEMESLREELAEVRQQLQTTKKNVTSLDRKMANRALNRDLKSLRTAIERLETKLKA